MSTEPGDHSGTSLLRRVGVSADGTLENPKLLYAKGFLFLLAGAMASGLLIAELPTVRVALLLAVAVWCFARFYYFAFYVVEHYVDADYRFAGLWSFARYLWRRNSSGSEANGR